MRNRVFEEYIKNVKQEMPQDYKDAKRFIDSLSCDLEAFLEENVSATYETLCAEFGYPHELIEELLDNFDSFQIKKTFLKQKRNKKIIYILAGIVSVLILFWIVVVPHLGIYITDTVYIYETESSEDE